MDMRKLVIIASVLLAGFAAWSNRDVSPLPGPDPGPTPVLVDTSAIAEAAHRNRAARQSELYISLADSVERGLIADASELGKMIEKSIDAIDAEVRQPLADDAAAKLPDGKFEDPAVVAKWLRDVAEGLARVAK